MAHRTDEGRIITCQLCGKPATKFIAGVFPVCEAHCGQWLAHVKTLPEGQLDGGAFFRWAKDLLPA
jgi:endogenous inhibitor of DNA gyrase (YacG/DUF329 family)